MTEPEFSFPIDVRHAHGREIELAANARERAALAARFALVRIDRLEAKLVLSAKGRIIAASGTFDADFVQSCAVSAEDLPVSVSEEILLRFVPERRDYKPDEEVELDADDCDEIEYSGSSIDLGEAVAQSLALAIDPFATGDEADQARSLFKSEEDSPFAALAKLRTPEKKPGKE